jgi:SAM-dependent methyltransferase
MAERHYAEGWAARLVREGRLPSRYAEVWPSELDEFAEPCVGPGMAILDVGPGPNPTIPPERRPPGTTYVSLDASREGVEAAPAGSYDEEVIADVGLRLPALEGRFDLVVSWQALEHVSSLRAAFDNLHAYLRDKGRMVAVLSGSRSTFAVLNRLVPHRLARRGMEMLLDRPPETTFRAHYDRCRSSAIRELLAGWSTVDVRPKYAGAAYLTFSSTLMRAYLRYEDWTVDRPDLATHYVVRAVR